MLRRPSNRSVRQLSLCTLDSTAAHATWVSQNPARRAPPASRVLLCHGIRLPCPLAGRQPRRQGAQCYRRWQSPFAGRNRFRRPWRSGPQGSADRKDQSRQDGHPRRIHHAAEDCNYRQAGDQGCNERRLGMTSCETACEISERWNSRPSGQRQTIQATTVGKTIVPRRAIGWRTDCAETCCRMAYRPPLARGSASHCLSDEQACGTGRRLCIQGCTQGATQGGDPRLWSAPGRSVEPRLSACDCLGCRYSRCGTCDTPTVSCGGRAPPTSGESARKR